MDQEAFAKLALAEMSAVHRLATHLARAQDADDLTQETFARAFRSWTTYRPGEHGMRPWLFKILHNALFSRLSDEQRRRLAHEQRPAGHADGAGRPGAGTDAAAIAPGPIDWEQVDGRLRDAVDSLPLHYKSVFLLSALEGLRYREIAAVIDVPIGTVMSRLCRARSMLAARLVDVAAERRLGGRPSSSSLSSPEPLATESEDRTDP